MPLTIFTNSFVLRCLIGFWKHFGSNDYLIKKLMPLELFHEKQLIWPKKSTFRASQHECGNISIFLFIQPNAGPDLMIVNMTKMENPMNVSLLTTLNVKQTHWCVLVRNTPTSSTMLILLNTPNPRRKSNVNTLNTKRKLLPMKRRKLCIWRRKLPPKNVSWAL